MYLNYLRLALDISCAYIHEIFMTFPVKAPPDIQIETFYHPEVLKRQRKVFLLCLCEIDLGFPE